MAINMLRNQSKLCFLFVLSFTVTAFLNKQNLRWKKLESYQAKKSFEVSSHY